LFRFVRRFETCPLFDEFGHKMKRFLAFLGSAGGLLLVVFILGSFLPRSHLSAASIKIGEPSRNVWRTLIDFPGWVSWSPGTRDMVRAKSADGREMWIVVTRTGKFPMEIMERRSPGYLVTRVSDPNLSHGETWTWVITPQGQYTTLTLTEKGEIYNPLQRFMTRYVWGYHSRQMDYLSALADYFHDDAEPVIVGTPTS
jgi:Polyketide cyclase / dehydrase and lipid transport